MLKQTILEDLKSAMKEGNLVKRDTLRMLDSAIKNVEIEKKKRETGLDDEGILEVIAKAVKQRKDSIAQYTSGGRSDLVEKEQKEIDVLSGYLPEQMGEDEIRKIVKETMIEVGVSLKSEIGKIMGPLMAKLKGKADGQIVRKIVEEELK